MSHLFLLGKFRENVLSGVNLTLSPTYHNYFSNFASLHNTFPLTSKS